MVKPNALNKEMLKKKIEFIRKLQARRRKKWYQKLPKDKIRWICLVLYMLLNSAVTIIMMSLIILAPARDYFVDMGLLSPLEE